MIIPGASNPPHRKIVGCTLAGPAYMDLARQARESFEVVTGLPCVLVRTGHDKNYASKFDLHHHFDDDTTVIYFDADTRWITAFNPLRVTTEFGMVLDPGRNSEPDFPIHDCRRLGMPWETYGNSGVMVFNAKHRPLWARCKEAMGRIPVYDFGEQSIINYCLHMMQIKKDLLEPEWNWAPVCIGHNRPQPITHTPYVIHAMGYTHNHGGARITEKEACLHLWESKHILRLP